MNSTWKQVDHHTWEELKAYTWGDITIDRQKKTLSATVLGLLSLRKKVTVVEYTTVAIATVIKKGAKATRWASILAHVSIKKKPSKVIHGIANATSAFSKTTSKAIASTVLVAGSFITRLIENIQVFYKAITSSVTVKAQHARIGVFAIITGGAEVVPSGNILKFVQRVLGGIFSPVAMLIKTTPKRTGGASKSISGKTNISFRVTSLTGKGLIKPVGSIAKKPTKNIKANMTPVGAILKHTGKKISDTVSPIGNGAKKVFFVVGKGIVSFIGNASKKMYQSTGGGTSASGNITKQYTPLEPVEDEVTQYKLSRFFHALKTKEWK